MVTSVLFALHARFRPDAEARRNEIHEQFSAHLGQTLTRVRLGGSLRGPDGARTGVLLLVEADDLEQAKHFAATSPYALAGLYERVEVDLLDLEAGSLG